MRDGSGRERNIPSRCWMPWPPQNEHMGHPLLTLSFGHHLGTSCRWLLHIAWTCGDTGGTTALPVVGAGISWWRRGPPLVASCWLLPHGCPSTQRGGATLVSGDMAKRLGKALSGGGEGVERRGSARGE